MVGLSVLWSSASLKATPRKPAQQIIRRIEPHIKPACAAQLSASGPFSNALHAALMMAINSPRATSTSAAQLSTKNNRHLQQHTHTHTRCTHAAHTHTRNANICEAELTCENAKDEHHFPCQQLLLFSAYSLSGNS